MISPGMIDIEISQVVNENLDEMIKMILNWPFYKPFLMDNENVFVGSPIRSAD